MTTDAASFSYQALVDYLVTATEQDDVLFVHALVKQLEEHQPPTEGASSVGMPHSRIGRSALSAVVRKPFTSSRELILQLLLLKSSAFDRDAALETAKSLGNSQAAALIRAWRRGERDGAVKAQQLLQLNSEKAEKWLNQNLPRHPDPSRFTGDTPLSPLTLLPQDELFQAVKSSMAFQPRALYDISPRQPSHNHLPTPCSSASTLVFHPRSTSPVYPWSLEESAQTFFSLPDSRRFPAFPSAPLTNGPPSSSVSLPLPPRPQSTPTLDPRRRPASMEPFSPHSSFSRHRSLPPPPMPQPQASTTAFSTAAYAPGKILAPIPRFTLPMKSGPSVEEEGISAGTGGDRMLEEGELEDVATEKPEFLEWW
ncbi:hypothetical protein JCM1840_003125 [Sporobolomyces johnsonii]